MFLFMLESNCQYNERPHATLYDIYDSDTDSFNAPTETFEEGEVYVSPASDVTASGESSSGDTDYEL